MKIVFIGSGNVATQLSMAFAARGHRVLQVYSRSAINAKKLAAKVGAGYTGNLDALRKDADLYIFAVNDHAIKELAAKCNIGNRLAVHTSGSVAITVLKKTSLNYGVLYPMQTFSKGITVNFSSVPIFVEGNNSKTEKTLYRIACKLTKKNNVHIMDSAQRKLVHLAAVFANNFSNHLFSIAEKMLRKNHLPFDLMKPLILQTAQKIQQQNPQQVQTGPAKRGDKKIINEHLRMLHNFPQYKKIYKLLSGSILADQKHFTRASR